MSEPLKSIRAMQRPLELALALRSSAEWLDINQRPIAPERGFLAGAVPVILDQVCDWWNGSSPIVEKEHAFIGQHSLPTSGREWPDARLEPSARLPWPTTWAEWVDGDALTTGRAYRSGLRLAELSIDGASPRLRASLPGADFLIVAHFIIQAFNNERPPVLWPSIGWGARADGTPVKDPTGRWLLVHWGENSPSEWSPRNVTPADIVWEAVGVWRLFTALMNVQGTRAVDTPLPRYTRRSFARIADGPAPWITYKTLSVFLPQKQNPESGNSNRRNAPPPGVPLHLVRAHLADYRQGRGLFGKYRSLVWVPAHRRGYARLGAISKTYEARTALDSGPTVRPIQ